MMKLPQDGIIVLRYRDPGLYNYQSDKGIPVLAIIFVRHRDPGPCISRIRGAVWVNWSHGIVSVRLIRGISENRLPSHQARFD